MTPEEAEIISAHDLVTPEEAKIILASHDLKFRRAFTELWEWSCNGWVGGLRPKRKIETRVWRALSKIAAKERQELVEPNVRILCNTDLYYRHGLFARRQEQQAKRPSILADVISTGVVFFGAIAELSSSDLPELAAIGSSAHATRLSREALTDLCWQVIDIIEAAEIEGANSNHKHRNYQIASATATDCYEAVTRSLPQKRRGRSDRNDHVVKILIATMIDRGEAMKGISAESESANSDEERRICYEAAEIAFNTIMDCCKALTRIEQKSERPNNGNESGLPKKRRTRSDYNYHAADIAIATVYCYEAVTGRRATVLTDWNKNRAYGPYFDLVKVLFEVFGIDAKPEHYARQALRV